MINLILFVSFSNEGAQSHAQQRRIPIILIAIPVAGGFIVLIGIAIILILCCEYITCDIINIYHANNSQNNTIGCCRVKRNKPARISTRSSIILVC